MLGNENLIAESSKMSIARQAWLNFAEASTYLDASFLIATCLSERLVPSYVQESFFLFHTLRTDSPCKQLSSHKIQSSGPVLQLCRPKLLLPHHIDPLLYHCS